MARGKTPNSKESETEMSQSRHRLIKGGEDKDLPHPVENVAYVQAFRQIGLLFGLAEGAFLLGERCTAPKVAGTLLILGGLAASVL